MEPQLPETPLIDIDNQKKVLEIQKLEVEIEQIKSTNSELTKKWYKKPQWIMALSPIILGLFTLVVAWLSGFLQAQLTLNKIQEENFAKRKDTIEANIKKIVSISDSLEKSLKNIKIEKASLDTAFTNLKLQNNALLQLRDTLEKSAFKTESEKIKFVTRKYISLQNEVQLYKGEINNYQDSLKLLKEKMYPTEILNNYCNLWSIYKQHVYENRHNYGAEYVFGQEARDEIAEDLRKIKSLEKIYPWLKNIDCDTENKK